MCSKMNLCISFIFLSIMLCESRRIRPVNDSDTAEEIKFRSISFKKYPKRYRADLRSRFAHSHSLNNDRTHDGDSMVYVISQGKSCGGALATINYVITSCLCLGNVTSGIFEVYKPSSVIVLAGSSGINFYESEAVMKLAKKIDIHEHCRTEVNRIIYDLGYVELSTPFPVTNRITPMKVPAWLYVPGRMLQFMIQNSSTCHVMSTKKNQLQLIPVTLQMFEICDKMECPTINQNDCSLLYQRHHHLCVIPISPQNFSDIDPGSPLICNRLIWGINIRGPEHYNSSISQRTIFARLDTFQSWWKKTVCA